MILKIKKLNPEAKLPEFAHAGDAGLDLFSLTEVTLKPGEFTRILTGVALQIPIGHVGLIWDKSGLASNYGLKVLGGVVDAGYRGEVQVGMINLSKKSYTIEKHHKVAQMLIQKVSSPKIKEVKKLSDTARGKGGFGSTGK